MYKIDTSDFSLLFEPYIDHGAFGDKNIERLRVRVAESLGNISGACDGCAPGVIEMYQDYIDGKGKQLNTGKRSNRRLYLRFFFT